LGRHDEALHHLRRALEIWKNSLEPLHPDLGLAHLALGNALGSVGAVSEAQVHYAAALAGWQEGLPEDHPLLAYAMTGLGRVHLQSDDVEAAIALLERALEIRDHEHEDALNLAETSLLLGRALWRDGSNTTRALELVVRARELVGALEPSQLAGLERVLGGGQVPRFTDQLGPAELLASDRRLRPR
jgi:tetratricopeptide (TPR) repeat protein